MRQIIEKPTSVLIPYARNSRTHSEQQVQQVAASIREFGFTNPVLIDEQNGIIAGHGRVLASQLLGLDKVLCIILDGLTEAQKRAYIIADNKLALNAGWDDEMLRVELLDLQDADFDMDLTGFSTDELAALMVEGVDGQTEPDNVPDLPVDPVSVPGDIWIAGGHRIMCGSSTMVDDVIKLMAGEVATLLHADPPYGMGKEGDGVANDNIYNEKLDQFQMEWWATFRTFIADNASAYIWGNAPDLWRLWYGGANNARSEGDRPVVQVPGLNVSERMTFRNEITWDKYDRATCKPTVIEMMRSYCNYTERCLFFMLGSQNFGNMNTEDFWGGFEPFRAYLDEQAKVMKWGPQDIMDMCGVGMYSHWFTKSQWTLIPEKHYKILQEHAKGKAFLQSYAQLKSGHSSSKSGGVTAKDSFDALRAYFDNTHENMTDVWTYPAVTGDERHGHATPKPVAMMERVMKSSLPAGGLCIEPFGGSGSTLMGAERTGRRCYTMELQPQYVDVIVKRWENHTGKTAILEGDGRTFAEIKGERKDGI